MNAIKNTRSEDMKRMTDAELAAVMRANNVGTGLLMDSLAYQIARQVEDAAYKRAIEAISKKTDHLDDDTGEWGADLAMRAVKELLVSAP